MNETFQIFFATSVRNSNCDLGEREVRHLDVGPTEPGNLPWGRGACAPSNFLLLWKKKIFPLKVASIQKKQFVFQISKQNIPNVYPELEI